jgi:hypothetical protein
LVVSGAVVALFVTRLSAEPFPVFWTVVTAPALLALPRMRLLPVAAYVIESNPSTRMTAAPPTASARRPESRDMREVLLRRALAPARGRQP